MFRVELVSFRTPDGISTLSNTLEAVKKYKQIILNALKAGADDDGTDH